MRHEKANGDLKKTRDACVQVLSSLELDEINEARRNGRANAARGDATRPDVGSQAGKRTGFHKGSNPNKKEKDENKPWEWRDWKPSDGSCTHCTEVLNEPASSATHWRKDCPNRAAALEKLNAAKKGPSGNGHGKMGMLDDESESDGDDSDPAHECDDSDDSELAATRGSARSRCHATCTAVHVLCTCHATFAEGR